MISRHHAAKMIKLHVRGDKNKLDNGVLPRATSEDTILESGKAVRIESKKLLKTTGLAEGEVKG